MQNDASESFASKKPAVASVIAVVRDQWASYRSRNHDFPSVVVSAVCCVRNQSIKYAAIFHSQLTGAAAAAAASDSLLKGLNFLGEATWVVLLSYCVLVSNATTVINRGR